MSPNTESGQRSLPREVEAARKRAAVELFARHEATLRRTASRYSLCADDAEDALQRGLEILLTKAPSEDQRELIRWTQTVVKHEALAVRRERERILSGPAARVPENGEDWVAMLPARGAGPAEAVERREEVARSREALQALKPQELRALGLLAEGYTYAEIGEITGFSSTKINRCLAEGRERFRRVLANSEDGSRCEEMKPLLSAFCDGEAGPREAATVREHLRACPSCRATMRAYRAAPGAVAALVPALPLGRSLLERAQQALADVTARFGGGGNGALSQIATAGGARGTGAAALAKVLAICAGTAGGAVACVATGVAPTPLDLETKTKAPAIERQLSRGEVADWRQEETPVAIPTEVEVETGGPSEGSRETKPDEDREAADPVQPMEVEQAAPAPEYVPEPAPVAAPPPTVATPISAAASPSSTAAGSAAGEFGP